MSQPKLHVSFYVSSIDIKDSILEKINTGNMIKLNLTQKPCSIQEDYIVNRIKKLQNIDHSFNITTTSKMTKKIILTIRKVEKKWCLENLFKFTLEKENKKNNNYFDPIVGRKCDKKHSNTQYKYEQLANSLIGYCEIDLEKLDKCVNNKLKVQILSKKDRKIIGYANLEIYQFSEKHFQKDLNNLHNNIIFEDKKCYLLDGQ